MKEKTMYVCETCGRMYEYLKDCRDCENKHLRIMKIRDKIYLNSGDKYPLKVNVLFDDGQTEWFRRESSC